jgi:CheY-like chemotaxis protein
MAPENSDADQFPILNRLTILLVDDDEDTLDLLQFIFEQCQAKVVSARSVQAALQIIEQTNVSIMISDIGMPDEDGYFLVRQVQRLQTERDRYFPTIALTAFAKEEDQQAALTAGFQQYLAKPVNPYDLIEVVVKLTNS